MIASFFSTGTSGQLPQLASPPFKKPTIENLSDTLGPRFSTSAIHLTWQDPAKT
jgi:hypothetical protein